jgi:hypothetical protein
MSPIRDPTPAMGVLVRVGVMSRDVGRWAPCGRVGRTPSGPGRQPGPERWWPRRDSAVVNTWASPVGLIGKQAPVDGVRQPPFQTPESRLKSCRGHPDFGGQPGADASPLRRSRCECSTQVRVFARRGDVCEWWRRRGVLVALAVRADSQAPHASPWLTATDVAVGLAFLAAGPAAGGPLPQRVLVAAVGSAWSGHGA